jgi:serine/threonine-protein kinase PknG
MTGRTACQEVDCTGAVAPDGYCDTCGTKGRTAPAPGPDLAPDRSITSSTGVTTGTSLTGPRGRLATGSVSSKGRRRQTGSARASTRRTSIGAGLVDVPPAPTVDPATAVLADPVVAEGKRYCGACDAPVGRSRSGRVGRLSGFCPVCGQRFDFEPKLSRGELVGGQYEVLGCLAHGGLGWIYLARDRAVNDRWVVLKGLLNATDQAAMAVALAEKRFLADIQHANIVDIYNFVPHRGAGYIVMEYVSGPSLKHLLARRREANGGHPDPLPVDQAIAFVLAVLPAFSYLHGRGLVYCDFKLDNVIQVGDRVKLIDLGAVRRLDDASGDIFGTVGFQAPEVGELGVSVASDLYTIGRTLAVLTLDFRGYQTTFKHALPDPADHPALARFDSFHRFLLKATAPHPDDRFQSAPEMGDQLMGVLQEVVAITTGRPQPAPSAVFAPPSDDEVLPALAIDAADPAAAFLANLSGDNPGAVLAEIEDALASGQVAPTVEVRLRAVRALVERGDHVGARGLLDESEADDPWEWRAVWFRGISALDTGALETATAAFDRCWSEVPGELAPKLAAASAAEARGDLAAAAALYGLVVMVDPSYIAAAKGLARCRAGLGDMAGAMAAYDRIPETHRAYAAAQLEAVRALVGAGLFAEAARRLEGLDIDPLSRARFDVEVFDGALRGLTDGSLAPSPATGIGGRVLEERSVRLGLEEALRRMARLTSDATERGRIVDRANRIRPVTLV